ncbi:hypothetical protein CMI37_21715 [Candidatus Pacearchaeota archaeon]|nr:hypothetical protein [Candidatus Pacearchaeota archaeon]|tara:strand:+ start:2477 stop:2908 length:432 start_codon:yes stop_codon:yes gene_type:complete
MTEPRAISFVVEGEPAGKARPRKGPHGFYSPDPKGFEASVAAAGTEARNKAGQGLFGGPVAMTVWIHRAMPKSWPRKRRLMMKGALSPTIPDTVNIVAAVADGLNQVLYEDDRQVVDISAFKVWGPEHRVEISVRPIWEVPDA